jgi:hypothetical protein
MLIHKGQVPPNRGVHKIRLPYDARIISVANQHEYLCYWFRFDETTLDTKDCTLRLITTGDTFPFKLEDRFLGTVLFENGAHVVHVFVEGI